MMVDMLLLLKKAVRCLLLCFLLMPPAAGPAVSGQDWMRFRGNDGSGRSTLAGIPVTWTDADIAWTRPLDHVGHSSPVIHGKLFFVTTATEGGGTRFLHCLNADTGVPLWQASVSMNTSHKHEKNSWASSTPATDGQRVYALFADDHTLLAAAWDFNGTEVWRRSLGAYESEHGLAASPIVHNGILIVPNDQVGPSSIIALKAESGAPVWSVERPGGKTSYSTPLLLDDGPDPLLICVSEASGVTGHEFATGRQLWQTPRLPMRTVASPVAAEGLVLACCGEGGNGKYFAAIHTSPDSLSGPRIAWERRTMLPYVPCPVIYNGLAFLWGDKGILLCVELQTGRELWHERINGAFSGSPVCIEDRLYCVSESGEVVVIHAGPEFRELGRTALNDGCHSTPAVANGHLYIHTFHRLVAIKATRAEADPATVP